MINETMGCDRPFDLTAYLKNELEDGPREAARAHVESCSACRTETERIGAVLKAVAAMPAIEPSPGFAARVRDAYVRAHPEALRRPASEPRVSLWDRVRARFAAIPTWSLSVAAHALLLSIAAALFLGPDPDDRRAAEYMPPMLTERASNWMGASRPTDDEEAVRPAAEVKAEALSDWRRDRVGTYEALTVGRTSLKDLVSSKEGPAIRAALGWLATRQSEDGRWPAGALGGLETYETGLTGAALLAFLADGQTHLSGAHANVVRRGVEWLLRAQRGDGRIGPDSAHAGWNHAVAALALTECWIMTGDAELRLSASAAIACTQSAQDPRGGWDPRDPFVGAWQTHLLRLAREAGIDGVAPGLIRARDRIAVITNDSGRIGNGAAPVTAAGAFAYILSSAVPERAQLEKYRDLIVADLQVSNNPHFIHFGSLALHQIGGAPWREWNAAVKAELLRTQRGDGSWEANIEAARGGETYATALSALTLQTAHRYPRFER